MSYFGSQAKRLGRKVEKETVEITKDRKNRRTKGRQKKRWRRKFKKRTVTKRSKKNWQKSQKPIKRTEK